MTLPTAFLNDPSLGGYIRRSLGIHSLVIAILLIVSLIQNYGNRPARTRLNLIKASVKVDVVGMPKLTFQELKALEKIAQQERAQSAAKERSKALAIKARERKSFREMLKKISQKKIATDDQAIRKKNKKAQKLSTSERRKLQNLVLAGNKVSRGSALTGELGNEAQAGLAEYMASLPDKVRPHWRLPSFLKEVELRCRIRIFLRADGTLIKAEILEGSGEAEYDRRAIEAVQATKFPPLDQAYHKAALDGRIVLGFPL